MDKILDPGPSLQKEHSMARFTLPVFTGRAGNPHYPILQPENNYDVIINNGLQ